MNRLIINDTVVSGKDIEAGSNFTSHAMVGETLSADQLSFDVNTSDVPFYPADQDYPLITSDHHIYFSKNDIDVSAFEDGDKILYYDNNALAGKYFFESLNQQGMKRYKITAVSIIGRLLDSRHYGGVYVGVPAADIFADILRGTNYVLEPEVASATVTGYLPISIRRDNLQQLLFATGSTVRVDDAGTIYISAMSSVLSGSFTADRVYVGGIVRIEKPVAGVKLTEHNYFTAGNVVTLFSDGVDGEEFIEFGEPYHSLEIEGGTIVESGANYAKIRATGTVTLTGKPYTHVTRIVTAGNVNGGSTENVKTVSGCYLANPQIAQALADRVYEFLKCNKTITQDVLTGTEKAGDVVSVINPYTMEMETATIKRYDITMSAVNKANAEFLVGFVPSGVLSGFTNHVVLTGSGTWTVPAGVDKIRIILIGAGGGGSGGKRGTAGEDSTEEGESGAGGVGGEAGKAGVGGRVFEISLDVTPGQTFNYVCGLGGIGGEGQTDEVAQSEGTAGTPTTFGGYSSDYGRQYPYGYFEAKTGITYAASGLEGYKGGNGGDGNDQWEDENENRMKGENGESVAEFSGGSGARARDVGNRNGHTYYGGGGGGAAYGANGEDADNYSVGGDGATGVHGSNATNYGQGGGAGHGGGGGGGGGRIYRWNIDYSNENYNIATQGGSPGNGTDGGDGADGVIIAYY